jgi:hypothetical protein
MYLRHVLLRAGAYVGVRLRRVQLGSRRQYGNAATDYNDATSKLMSV